MIRFWLPKNPDGDIMPSGNRVLILNRRRKTMRKAFLLTVVVLVAAGVAFAAADEKGKTKKASGEVKSVAGDSLKVTEGDQEWTFVVDSDTLVVVKGGTHQMKEDKVSGKKSTLTDFVREKQKVTVEYHEMDGKLHATKITVRIP